MRQDHPVAAIILSMDDEVADVGRWADVIRDLGTGDSQVAQNGLFAIGGAMMELAERLEQKWKAAVVAVGGRP